MGEQGTASNGLEANTFCSICQSDGLDLQQQWRHTCDDGTFWGKAATDSRTSVASAHHAPPCTNQRTRLASSHRPAPSRTVPSRRRHIGGTLFVNHEFCRHPTANMNGQAIPGFYYDAEKKKYFKIQSATASRDLHLKYSAHAIRKKEREDRVQSIASAHIKRARKERVTRQHAGNVTQTCFERESGMKRRSFYVQYTWPDACVYGMSTRPKKVIDNPSGPLIRRFDRDPVSKTMYIVHGDNSIKRRRVHRKDGPPLPDQNLREDEYLDDMPLNEYSFEPWDELQRTTSTVSSLTYLPATGALATTTFGSDRAPVVYLSDPERDGPYVGQQFTPKACSTIWGAAARPTTFEHSPGLHNTVAASHVEHLAVAASSSMLLFTRSQSGTWDSTTPLASLETDILALDWISYTTVALGCRDGKIRLYDTRSGGSSHILTHPHAVSKIKRADDQTRLIVSGLQDSLHLYDIRSPCISRSSKSNHDDHHYNQDYFENLYPGGRNHKKRRKMNHIATKYWSQPILTFPHSNIDDLELDINVHPRLGLVAAGQNSEINTPIRVSNMWTGQTVKEFKRNNQHNGSDRIRSLRFMDDEEEGGVSLWASWGGGIARFGW
jgi:WD40 repeat protein